MAKNIKIKISFLLTLIIFTISFTVIPAHGKTDNVIIGGEPFGLKLYCKGVMVTKFESFYSNNEKVCPGKACGLTENDIITKINNKEVNSNEELGRVIEDSNGNKISLEVLRNDTKIDLTAIPVKNQDKYCLGIWVRDSCAGIGTITYYDSSNYTYGALGHGICDIDSGGLMVSDNVEILEAEINGATKSESNNIGTLNGYFTENIIASVGYNNNIGIYGKINNIPQKKTIPVANSSEIEIGKALIYSTVEGTTPEAYEIEITKICNSDENTNQNFIFKVTDNRLINKTGGIVQGMSGSPIVQNNKIIGAVTHVMINDPTMGYGIQIQNMLNCSDRIN